jgi:hypothetical protein
MVPLDGAKIVIFGRRAMKRIAVLALMVAGLSGSALCQYSAEFRSYYSGKHYDFRITTEQLSSTPPGLTVNSIRRFRPALRRILPLFT